MKLRKRTLVRISTASRAQHHLQNSRPLLLQLFATAATMRSISVYIAILPSRRPGHCVIFACMVGIVAAWMHGLIRAEASIVRLDVVANVCKR